MSNFLPDILTTWIYAETFSARQLADAAECGVSTLYKYAEGERNIPFARARRIARFASRHGHNDVARALLSSGYEVCERGEGRADGCLDNEIGAISEALGMARRSHRNGNRNEISLQIREIERQLHNLKAERDRT